MTWRHVSLEIFTSSSCLVSVNSRRLSDILLAEDLLLSPGTNPLQQLSKPVWQALARPQPQLR